MPPVTRRARPKSLLEELAALNNPAPTHEDPEDNLWDNGHYVGIAWHTHAPTTAD